MNSSGFDKGYTLQFLGEGDDPFELEKEYWFSEWYQLIVKICCSPVSYILHHEDLYNGEIDRVISTLSGKQCFARLDPCSAKPENSYKSALEISNSFLSSNRCKPYFKTYVPVIIREYVRIPSGEFRCYIHDKNLRAISSEVHFSTHQLEDICNTVKKITFHTDYESYSVDFTFMSDGRLMLIEINTPVWLFASSGLFDLDVPWDREVLCGMYQPDIIQYPVVRVADDDCY